MANRSDFQSVFPRQLKRLWTLTKFDDAHQAGSWKRDFISAHARHKSFVNKKRSNNDGAAVPDTDVTESV
jgi:hypothetical protein